jgi:hypothetical protein
MSVLDAIITAALDTSVAQAADVLPAQWDDHVFFAAGGYCGPLNLGRMPFVVITDTGADYQLQAQPHHEGTRVSQIDVTVYARAFLTTLNEAQALIDAIMNAIAAAIRDTQLIELGNESRGQFESVPCGFKRTMRVTVEMGYNKTYNEGGV